MKQTTLTTAVFWNANNAEKQLRSQNEMTPDIFESDWFKSRPDNIKEMCRLRPPGKYLMEKTGKDYYVPYSYSEDGTMTAIRCDHRTEKPMWTVFGLKPEDLIPMEQVPAKDSKS